MKTQCILPVLAVVLTGSVLSADIRRDLWEPFGQNKTAYTEVLMRQFDAGFRKPHKTDALASFEVPNRAGKQDYAQRLYGFLLPAVTGEYSFYISADDHGSLLLSSDESEANAKIIARSGSWPKFRNYTQYPSQTSKKIRLEKGKKYYIEAAMMNTNGPGYISVAWKIPGSGKIETIPGAALAFSVRKLYRPVDRRAAKQFSVAGFYISDQPGDREVFSFNPGWRFLRKNVPDAWKENFDDSRWELVSVPHNLELLHENGNGLYWYKGKSWYRKHFTLDPRLKGKKLSLYFEGVMQVAEIWINGKKCHTNYGGYLPFTFDIGPFVRFGKPNVIAVLADNSDQRLVPPGGTEAGLDFCYYGGIYRDVWMIAVNPVHVTEVLHAERAASGGVFLRTKNVSGQSAGVSVRTEIVNESSAPKTLELVTVLKNTDGTMVAEKKTPFILAKGEAKTLKQSFTVVKPRLWTPDTPELYFADTLVKADGRVLEGVRTRFGIRSLTFVNAKLYINGKPWRYLAGGNKHQDMAYIGNAVPNSGHYRDAKLMREAAMTVFRSHYPQDPAFMDACDEFGILAVTPTPGWWHFVEDPVFIGRWHRDVRSMVRINRNRPSCFLWEVSLNETFTPEKYLNRAHEIAHEEFPGPECYTVSDVPWRLGSANRNYKEAPRKYPFDVGYGDYFDKKDWQGNLWKYDGRPLFGREALDFLDGGGNHVLRGIRADGEYSLYYQARFLEIFWRKNNWRGHIGSCLWTGIDAFASGRNFGTPNGVIDHFRFPKTSFYLFKSQNDPTLRIPGIPTGPMVFIANYLTAFSPEDIVVYTNCEKVRLTFPGPNGKKTVLEGISDNKNTRTHDMPHPNIVFKNVFRFREKNRALWIPPREGHSTGTVTAEGFIGGKLAAKDVRKTTLAAKMIRMEIDDAGIPLTADGSDFVIVRCYFTDENGTHKILARNPIYLTVEGEGEVIGGPENLANPFQSQFGSAAFYVRSTTRAGVIRLKAKSLSMGQTETILVSVPPAKPLLLDEHPGRQKHLKKVSGHFQGRVGDTFKDDMFKRQLIITPGMQEQLKIK